MKNLHKVTCRQCGYVDVVFKGKMTQADTFCGAKLPSNWDNGSLYECRRCHLSFRHPVLEKEEYLKLYQAAPESTYQNKSLRHDQFLVREAIKRYRLEGTVLDVGCFNGALLLSLGPKFEKYGIEASDEAKNVCVSEGIKIVASSAEELVNYEQKYDVICAVDVVEHLIYPHNFVTDAVAKLKPNGLLIISTGNASNNLWKLFGGRYWYCQFPEHISFISPEWVTKILKKHPLQLLELENFAHENLNISKISAYFRFVGRFVRASFESALMWKSSKNFDAPKYKLGMPGVVSDHMLVVLQLKS